VSACKDGKPMLRYGDCGLSAGTFENHKGAVFGVAINRQATLAASASGDFTARVWDTFSGTEFRCFEHKHIVKSVDFDKNSQLLLTGSNEKLIKIFDLKNPEPEPVVTFSGHSGSIKRAIFYDDKRIISCAEEEIIKLWDRSTGKEVQNIYLPAIPTNMEMSRDGSVLLVTYGKKVSFYDMNMFSKIKDFDVPTRVSAASLHPNKSVFVCGGDDFKVYKLNYNSGQVLDSLSGHFGVVHALVFSPDGELYASGSEDGTVRLWQTVFGKEYGIWKQPGTVEAAAKPHRSSI